MRQLISLFLLILVIQTFLTVHLNAVYGSNSIVDKQKAHSDDVVPNVIIIKFSEYQTINESTISTQNPVLDNRLKDAGILSLKSIFSRQPSRLKKSITTELSNIYMAHFQGKKTPWEVSELISSWPEIVYAEPKYLHYIVETIPNDTLYENNQSAYYEVIEAPKAWDRVKGEQGEAIIAIVDGGTEIGHIDLSDNIWQNQVEVDGEIGVDDDDNGFIDDLYGWNFPNQSGDPTGLPNTSNADHGTHVAGIACAVTNNITGVAGTSWNATLMGINASDESSDRLIAYGIEGILYAAENEADIINCSWGRQGGYSYYEQEIINHATSLGAVVIAAAGNNNSDLSFYPASYANVLSVAGTDVDDNRYWDSNYGPNVDLAAPGVNIFSTFSDNTYGYSTGTSMSSPVVAGAAGLVKIEHPEWSGIQLGEQVRVTADLLPEEAGQLGRGRLNAYRAVTETSPSIRIIDYKIVDEDGDGTVEPGEKIDIYITIRNYLELATDVILYLTSSDPYVTITQPEIYLPSIQTMEEIELETPFLCDISEDAPAEHTVEILMNIATNEYDDSDYLSFTILPGYKNLTVNNIKMTVTSSGKIVNANLTGTQDTVGVSYKFKENLLYEGTIISGTSATQISNAARAGYDAYDEDFMVTPDGMISIQHPGILGDEESFSRFVDQNAVNPMNIEISQYTYAWEDSVDDDYIIMQFVIRNLNATDLTNFHFGWFFDWDIDSESYDTNVIRYNSERKIGMAYDAGDGPGTHVGFVSLSDEEMNFEAIYNDDLGVFTYARKWETISSGVTIEQAGPADVSFVIANGPIMIPAHSIHRLAFAMVAADDSLSLIEHADSARAMWEELIVLNLDQENQNFLPVSFGLFQNYPNPFNPTTIINYELQITNYVELKIYNTLGQEVATLVSENLQAGPHQVEWDARDLSSGVYFYHLQAGGLSEVRKMVLMK